MISWNVRGLNNRLVQTCQMLMLRPRAEYTAYLETKKMSWDAAGIRKVDE